MRRVAAGFFLVTVLVVASINAQTSNEYEDDQEQQPQPENFDLDPVQNEIGQPRAKRGFWKKALGAAAGIGGAYYAHKAYKKYKKYNQGGGYYPSGGGYGSYQGYPPQGQGGGYPPQGGIYPQGGNGAYY